MTRKRIHIKKPYFLVSAWLLTCIVMLPLASFFVVKTWESHKDTLENQIDRLSDGIKHDISTYLLPLNTQSATTCTPATIEAMQQADYRAKNLTIFALVRHNQIICTTESGNLAAPIPLREPNWLSPGGVKVILDQPVPIFNEELRGRTVQVGDFLAFLEFQLPQGETGFTWLKYANFGLDNGKKAYNYGTGGFVVSEISELTSGQQWYEDGHWLYSDCPDESACKVIAIDILGYFQEQTTTTTFLAIFFVTITSLGTIIGCRLYSWLNSLPNQVRQGLNVHQLNLHYQPIVGLGSGKIEGCEVLCRWHTPEGTLIRPDEFIRVVENNQQSRELTELVITKCIGDFRAAGLLGKCRIAINAFPDDIASGHILRVFNRLLPLKDFSLFTIELTEQKVNSLPALCEGVRQLRTLGFRVAIDDFGTGYSNLEGLREMNVDILKIDRCFIWGAETPSLKQSLIKHIVNIANSLDLKTVAEGVETQKQLAYISSLGVDYSQGYLHSRPVCLQEFRALVVNSYRY